MWNKVVRYIFLFALTLFSGNIMAACVYNKNQATYVSIASNRSGDGMISTSSQMYFYKGIPILLSNGNYYTSHPASGSIGGQTFTRGSLKSSYTTTGIYPVEMKEYEICFNFTPANSDPTRTYIDTKSFFKYSTKQAHHNGELIGGLSQIYVPPMSYMPGGHVLFKNGYIYYGPEAGSGDLRELSTDHPIVTNAAPVSHNGSILMAEDTTFSTNLSGSDPDGDSLTYHLVTPPSSNHGTVSISGGKATFTPKDDWNGNTYFTFRVRDSGGLYSNISTISVTVTPVNDVPSVIDHSLSLDEDTMGTHTLEVSDVDLQFEGDSHTWSIVT
ncbi:Ig-like domain-containing protein, partial [Stutzerimonas stutzeri]